MGRDTRVEPSVAQKRLARRILCGLYLMRLSSMKQMLA